MTRCMTGFKTRRDACSAVGTAGARMVHAIPTMLALRRGSGRLVLVLIQESPGSKTYWPEGRRRGRAGGRQEYRHLYSLAQPWVRLSRKHALRTSCRVPTFRAMSSETPPASSAPSPASPNSHRSALHTLAAHIEAYQRSGDVGQLLDQLKALAKRTPADELPALANEYREMPEVVIPLYERVVAEQPANAQAIVVLANSYWLTGRGPDVVGQMATRAKQLDPSNRGAWHLWALAEPDLRKRVDRWLEVAKRFPSDQLARAALADNATSLANDEEDAAALDLAIATYEGLLAESTQTAQRLALEHTLETLRTWRF
jgi:hypothetical protein